MALDLSLKQLFTEQLTDRRDVLLDDLFRDSDENTLSDVNDLIFVDLFLLFLVSLIIHFVFIFLRFRCVLLLLGPFVVFLAILIGLDFFASQVLILVRLALLFW